MARLSQARGTDSMFVLNRSRMVSAGPSLAPYMAEVRSTLQLTPDCRCQE